MKRFPQLLGWQSLPFRYFGRRNLLLVKHIPQDQTSSERQGPGDADPRTGPIRPRFRISSHMSTSHRAPYPPLQITLPSHKRNSLIKAADPRSTYPKRKTKRAGSSPGHVSLFGRCPFASSRLSRRATRVPQRQQEHSKIYFRHQTQPQQRRTR